MTDYLDKLNETNETVSGVQEPEATSSYHNSQLGTKAHHSVSKSSMPCYFSEAELDQEIALSLQSGNATKREVDAVFYR
ncbi:MAG: hypothetical protein J5720_08840 [Bacteroidaceae bacterium]|nr:hypothetical protein [Bacteroidaceae bacterium]